MAIVEDMLEFQKLCKKMYVRAYYSRGYYEMLHTDMMLSGDKVAVLSHYTDSDKYVCVLTTSIPNDRMYAQYEYIKETSELHENFYMRLSEIEYGEEDI